MWARRQDVPQSLAAERLGDGVRVRAAGRLERVLERVPVLAGDAMQAARAVERLMLERAGAVDGHPRLAHGAHPRERAERHAPLRIPRADRAQDAEPRVLGEVVAVAAGHDVGHRDVARHRLVELDQPRLRRAVAALGVAQEPSLPDRCRGRRGRTVAGDHGRRP